MIRVLYRISNNSYNKLREPYATKENCLYSALKTFIPDSEIKWVLFQDNINSETDKMITKTLSLFQHEHVSRININTGSGAASFNVALSTALSYDKEDIIAFLEDDYAWDLKCLEMVLEGIKMGADYITTYLHPDKFIPPSQGGNPQVHEDGGYVTKLFRGEQWLWFIVNSTTMTFFTKVSTLKHDEHILRKFTAGTYPRDYEMFLELQRNGKILLCPVESGCTHLETQWLAPYKDWSKII